MEKKTSISRICKAFLAIITVAFLLESFQGRTQTHALTLQNDSSNVLFLKLVKVENAGSLINTSQDEEMALSNTGGTSIFYNETMIQKEKFFVMDSEINLAIMFKGVFQKQTIDLKKPLNKRKWRTLAGYSHFNKELYLHRNNGGGDLYSTSLKDTKRDCPKKLGKHVNSKYNETMITTNQDGSEMYFISDRPGGIGGKDIWMSKRNENNSWDEAVNLGSTINTDRDEVFVWINADGNKIWFSSQGHQSMGGFDLFFSEKLGNKWKKPQNPGFPVNSVDDEISISLNADGSFGFLVSNRRDGFGGFDIYTVKFPNTKKEFVLSEITEPINPVSKTIPMKGIIFDSDTKAPLKATIQVTDNENIQLNYINNPENGKYLIFLTEAKNSRVVFDADGYLPHFENISLVSASPSLKPIQKDIALQKLKIGKRSIFKNILFEFGKDNLKPESVPELLRIVDLMERYPAMEMEVQGHCDHIGSRAFNQKLSEKRAGSVVKYLSASGITKTRLIAVGKGEDFPVAPNVNPNGTDNPEGRMLNRRTEFLIQKLN